MEPTIFSQRAFPYIGVTVEVKASDKGRYAHQFVYLCRGGRRLFSVPSRGSSIDSVSHPTVLCFVEESEGTPNLMSSSRMPAILFHTPEIDFFER
ncbi:hypothetical protein LXL04_014134 [Taraxacum kok-saghyz]